MLLTTVFPPPSFGDIQGRWRLPFQPVGDPLSSIIRVSDAGTTPVTESSVL